MSTPGSSRAFQQDFSRVDNLLRERHARTLTPNRALASTARGLGSKTSPSDSAVSAGTGSSKSTPSAANDSRRGDIQRLQASDPPYAKLCNSVSDGPLAERLQLQPSSSRAAGVQNFLMSLLNANPNFEGDAHAMIENRLQDAHLLLDSRPAKGLRGGHDRKRKRSRKSLSMRRHRLLGSYAMPEDATQHTQYLELHEMWKDYAEDVVHQCNGNEAMIQSRLLTADLHGVVLAVVESKDPALVGNRGIMVRETAKTFGLVTAQDKFVIVPKVGSVFRLIVGSLTLTLFGSNLGIRESGSGFQRE